MWERVIPYLKNRYHLKGTIKARILHTAGIGESQVDEWVGDLETNPNPIIGLLANSGQVDIRITAQADSEDEADQLIGDMEYIIRQRLGENIYGADDETLEALIIKQLEENNINLWIAECGFGDSIQQRMKLVGFPHSHFKTINQPCDLEKLKKNTRHLLQINDTNAAFGASLNGGEERQTLQLCYFTSNSSDETVRYFGGSPEIIFPWAVNTALDFIRRSLNYVR